MFADFQRTEFRENSQLIYMEADTYQTLTETAEEFEHSLLSYVPQDNIFKDQNAETEQQEEEETSECEQLTVLDSPNINFFSHDIFLIY